MAEQKNKTAPERRIEAQVATSGPKDDRSTGITKVEQPATSEEIPDTAEVVRQYAKWTDNDGTFHKVPIDGTTAIREPAHEQHELTVEDRDRLDQALALKTPRRDNAKAAEIVKENVHNDEVHEELASANKVGTAPVEKLTGGIKDDHEDLTDDPDVEVGTPAKFPR